MDERKAKLGVGPVHLYLQRRLQPSTKGTYGFIHFYMSITCRENLNAYSLPYISFFLVTCGYVIRLQSYNSACGCAKNNLPLKIYQAEKSCCRVNSRWSNSPFILRSCKTRAGNYDGCHSGPVYKKAFSGVNAKLEVLLGLSTRVRRSRCLKAEQYRHALWSVKLFETSPISVYTRETATCTKVAVTRRSAHIFYFIFFLNFVKREMFLRIHVF